MKQYLGQAISYARATTRYIASIGTRYFNLKALYFYTCLVDMVLEMIIGKYLGKALPLATSVLNSGLSMANK